MNTIKQTLKSLTFLLLFSSSIYSQQSVPFEVKEVGISENINVIIPLGETFYNATGTQVTLEPYFQNNKPKILFLAYYTCPMLCNLLADSVVNVVNDMDDVLGIDYDLLTFSFDPEDNQDTTARFKEKYTKKVSHKLSGNHWNFFYGEDEGIGPLTEALGFNYNFIEETGEYAHSSAIIVLSPSGKITRYFYGVEFEPKDVKLALIEAKEEIGRNTIEKVLLFCYNYDPLSRGYVLQAWKIMRIAALITIIGLISAIFYWMKKTQKGRKK